jgi:uncharacterized protein with ParB-like and HNH nuclease domain
MNLQFILNKNSPQPQIESESNMLSIFKKLVKYVAHLLKRKY